MSKFNIGDLVEFIPGNYLFPSNNCFFWLEGAGLILDLENNKYVIHVFSLKKTSTKNLAEFYIGETILRIPIDECDKQNCLRSLEE